MSGAALGGPGAISAGVAAVVAGTVGGTTMCRCTVGAEQQAHGGSWGPTWVAGGQGSGDRGNINFFY